VSFEDQLRVALDRVTDALRAQLERDLSGLGEQLKRVVAEERERAARANAEVDALKRALAAEQERAAQQAAEFTAADMRRQAEMQSQIAQFQEGVRRRIEELQRAADEERDRAVQEARDAALAEARRQADAQIAQLRDATQKHADELRRAAEEQVNEIRTTLQSQLEDVRRTANSQIEDARSVAASQVDDVQRRADEQIAETRRDLEAQVEEVRRRARADLENARTELETARGEAEEVVIAQLAAAHAQAERKIEAAIDRTRTDAHQAELAYTAKLVDAMRRLDDSRTLAELLDALTECAAKQVERAAMLIVRGDKLRVLRLAGFAGERPTDDLDMTAAGLAGAVVNSGVTLSRAGIEPGEDGTRQPALPSFAQDAGARHAVALPILVGGRVVAVLYGDAERSDSPSTTSRWPATLEVLVRHASRALEAVTVQRAAGLSLSRPPALAPRSTVPGPVEHSATGEEDAARRYARLLLSEIRMYHEPLVDAGRRSRDLRLRLGGEIDRARRMYEERVPPTVRDRSDYFEQELVRTLADGDRSLLG